MVNIVKILYNDGFSLQLTSESGRCFIDLTGLSFLIVAKFEEKKLSK